MKLQHLHEDFQTLTLLRKTAKELGLPDPGVFQLTSPEEPGHHDSYADVMIAIESFRLDVEGYADVLNAVTSIKALRAQDDLGNISRMMRAAAGTPIAQLPTFSPVKQAAELMTTNLERLIASAENIRKIINLLKAIKAAARPGDHEPGSEESFRQTVARTVLKKLNIPLERPGAAD